MSITHMLLGAAVVAAFDPAYVPAALLGGLLPDLDVAFEHRRTMHFPVYYGVAAVSAFVSYISVGSGLWLQVAAFFFSASFHCWSDILGSGLEPRPWLGTDHRGVYSHYHGRWFRARHFVYDGSPGDLVISALAGGIMVLSGYDWRQVAALLALAAAYAAVRKKLPDLEEKYFDGSFELSRLLEPIRK